MADPTRTITVSIPRNAIWHLLTGLALTVVAAGAFVALSHLPAVSPYRLAIGLVGVIGACGTLAYWLWCTLQRNRNDEAASHEAIAADLTALRASADERAEQARARESAILDAVEDLSRNHKELIGRVDALVDIVEVLRDCYLEEGRVQDDAPRTSPPRELP